MSKPGSAEERLAFNAAWISDGSYSGVFSLASKAVKLGYGSNGSARDGLFATSGTSWNDVIGLVLQASAKLR